MTRPTDPLAPLRDSGQRAWRRFSPPTDLPATCTVVTATGRLKARVVVDLSMGGVGMRLKWRDKARLKMGEAMHIELQLDGRQPVRLRAKCVHMQRREGTFRDTWTAGLEFESDVGYQRAKPRIASYLLAVVEREQVARAA